MKKSLKMSVQMFGVAGLVVLAGCGNGKSATTPEAPPAPTPNNIVEAEVVKDASVALNGVIETEIFYVAPDPAGREVMPMTLTFANDVVTAAKTEVTGVNPISIKHQAPFAEALSAAVIGKSVSEIADIDVIAGASLTTGGFKEAIAAL